MDHCKVTRHEYSADLSFKSYKGQWELGSCPGIRGWTPEDVDQYMEFWSDVRTQLDLLNSTDSRVSHAARSKET